MSAVWFALMSLVLLAPGWTRARMPFWGDLTYIHHPWRTLPCQLLQAGHLPLWNPYLYFGMPMHASMQGGIFYPGSVSFALFSFPIAAFIFYLLHYFLAGFWTYLWLRSLRLARSAALIGATAGMLSGLLISRVSFLNHLAVLSFLPAVFLFFRHPIPLALALACSFFAGYPTFLIGSVVLAWILAIVLAQPGARPLIWLNHWVIACGLALTLSACLLLPAAELVHLSRRGLGLGAEESLSFSYGLHDFWQWVSPVLVGWHVFDPAVDWWKCAYWGLIGWIMALVGFYRIPRRRALALAMLGLAVAFLVLGRSFPQTTWLWTHCVPLHFIRYPGNLSYLVWPILTLTIAAGAEAFPARFWFCLALVVELLIYAWAKTPLARNDLFARRGSLVQSLQASLGVQRYLLSPRALERDSGSGVVDWRDRLYGLTNAPYRLRSAGNFGEPLVLCGTYAFMDALYSAPSAEGAAALFPWADIRLLLTTEPVKSSQHLMPIGQKLWDISRYNGPIAGAYWFTQKSGAQLPQGLPTSDLVVGQPLDVSHPREDRFSISGAFLNDGWVFISEPLYPGWQAVLETQKGAELAHVEPALAAFQKIPVPAGSWRLSFVYDPRSWRLGRLLSVFSILALALYWYNRALRAVHVL